MSFRSLSARLTALQETTAEISDLITRLANLKFQPGSVPLASSEENVTTELSSEIHHSLKELSEDLELLRQEIDDLPSGRPGSELEKEKDKLASAGQRAETELRTLRTTFRRAQLTAKANLTAAQRAERALLLSSYAQPADLSSSTDSLPAPRRRPQAAKPLTQDEKLVAGAADVTAALRRTHTLMAAELSRSQFAHDTLKESTAALAQLGESYGTLDTLLARSRGLLGVLMTSQKSDTWYLETAFWVLVGTVGWLVFRRFIYGPAWWLVWMPLKIWWKAWMGVFTAVGLRGGVQGGVELEKAMVGTRQEAVVEGSDVPVLCVDRDRQKMEAEGGLVEEVGKLIDDTERQEDRNPKKRMWVEDVESEKEEQRVKSEL